jgi:hypothetical protein
VVSVHYKLLEHGELVSFDYSFGHVRYNIYDSILSNSENAFHVTSEATNVSLEEQHSDVDYVQLMLGVGVEIVAYFFRDVVDLLHFRRAAY